MPGDTSPLPREPGLRPLPWQPWKLRPELRWPVLLAWFASLLLSLGLGWLAIQKHWFNYPVGSWHLGIYPPWTIGLIWTVWAGWAYGASIVGITALYLSLIAGNGAWSIAIALSDPAALGVFAICLIGFPVDPRLRSLRDAGQFLVAAFIAAVVGSVGTVFVHLGSPAIPVDLLLIYWEGWWSGHAIEAVLLAGPLLTVTGVYLERWKRQHQHAPKIQQTFTFQLAAAGLAGVALVYFYSAWTWVAGKRVPDAVHGLTDDDKIVGGVLEAHARATLNHGVLVGTLLGLLATCAMLALLLRRRYTEQMRYEIMRNTEALRRRQMQLAVLQSVAESTAPLLEPAQVAARLAEQTARQLEPMIVCVYLRDPFDPARLRRMAQFAPGGMGSRAEAPLDLAIDSTLVGRAAQEDEVVVIETGVREYSESTRRSPFLSSWSVDGFIGIPIQGEQGKLGAIALHFDRTCAPDEEERRLYRLIGRAAGTAFERAGIHAESRRMGAHLATLYRLTQELASFDEPEPLLDCAAQAARELLGAECAVAVLERVVTSFGEPRMEVAAVSGPVVPGMPEPFGFYAPPIEGLAAHVIREGRPEFFLAPNEAEPLLLLPGWRAGAAFCAPLVAERGQGGALLLSFPAHRRLGSDEMRLAEEFARLASESLRRIRLLSEIRRRSADVAMFDQIGRALGENLSSADILERLSVNLPRVFPAEWTSVYEFEAESNQLISRASTMPQPAVIGFRLSLDRVSIIGSCFKEGQTIVSPDLLSDPRAAADLREIFKTRSAVAVPLGPKEARFGVLFAANPYPREFSNEDVKRMEQIAALASAALQRARLHEEVQQRAEELALLNRAAEALVETPVLEASLKRVTEIVQRHFDACAVRLYLVAPTGRELVPSAVTSSLGDAGTDERLSLGPESFGRHALEARNAFLIADAEHEPRLEQEPRGWLTGVRSLAAASLSGVKGAAGLLVVCFDRPWPHGLKGLRQLKAVARLAATAVERGALSEALERSEERLLEVLDGLPALVMSLDLSGVILSINGTAERITGYRREEVLGRSSLEVLYPDEAERQRAEKLFADAIHEGGLKPQTLTTITTKAGDKRQIRWNGARLENTDGLLTGVVAMGVDVTDQMQLEAQFLQAQKMESVGALAGGMAHDFNNLLGGILGQVALARNQLGPDPVLTPMLGKIEGAAQRGADLTRKLLAFARKSVLHKAPVDVGALLRETAELLAGSLPRNITVILQAEPGMPKVLGDATQLQQVLMNLCVNGRDAMPTGGTLTLKGSSEPEGVRVDVTDTGAGMSAETKRRLFEPFFTTKAPGKGTGLGLPVVLGVVQSHGGTVTVESELGQGTRFCVRLPAVKTNGDASVTPHDPASPRGDDDLRGTESLLVIDDELLIRETNRQLLSSFGYDVILAASGEEALRLLDSGASKPRLIILDVMMPGLAGPALLKELKQHCPKVPVVLVTGYAQDPAAIEMLRLGAAYLINKPYSLNQLAGTVRRTLDFLSEGAG